MNQQPTPDDHPDATSNEVDDAIPPYTRTPLFQAYNAPRYQRQEIIGQIQASTGCWLICYVSGNQGAIESDDVMTFVDLLHNLPPSEDIDLLLHTGGGSGDAAEKLISMVRRKVGQATLRIIVPDFAKSAGTLMVLAADHVVMSDSSELGPIDPQTYFVDSNGTLRLQAVQNYLDAYEEHTLVLQSDPGNAASQIMLSKLDPGIVTLCRAAKDRARQSAESLLKKGMFRGGGNWSKAVSELLDTQRWLSHSQMISWEDAHDPQIGLHVNYLEPQSEQWQGYWRLYCLQRLAVSDTQKLFESVYVSQVIESSAG